MLKMKPYDSFTKKAEHPLGCSALCLHYPELTQCFNPRRVTDITHRLKSLSTWHWLNQAFAFPREFPIPRVERQTARLPEPHIRSIVERKIPCTRQRRDLRRIKINHALGDQLFPCRQKSIHQILRHPASPNLLEKYMSEFIPPENGSNPLGIHFQQTLSRTLHIRISDEKIRHHCAIDNNHGEKLTSPLTSRKLFIELMQ